MSSDNLKCPQCNAEIEDKVAEGMSIKCRSCGTVFLYSPKVTKSIKSQIESKKPDSKAKYQVMMLPDGNMFSKVVKCPHCDKFIILKIPVIIKTEIEGMSKIAAEKCPKCKGKKVIKDADSPDGQELACDKCEGIGAIPIEKKKDE